MNQASQNTQRSILLVEDDEATRCHLMQSINAHPLLCVSQACATLEQGREALQQNRPDVLVTDLGLPDGSGVELIKMARALTPPVEVMVITVFGDERNVLTAIEAGAGSYLLKDGDTAYIGKAIIQLLEGESPISAAIARQLLKRFQSTSSLLSSSERDKGDSPLLTERETEVLSCMAKGYTYNEAADILGMSQHTVTSHIKNIYRKLEVNSRSEAVFQAVRLGLVDMQS